MWPHLATRSPYFDRMRFHWAGFSADLHSLEGGGWNVHVEYDYERQLHRFDARHRTMNLAFGYYFDEKSFYWREQIMLPLNLELALLPPDKTVPELLDQVLTLQARNK